MTSAVRGVVFDILATGDAQRISWTAAGSDDAWLTLDRNGNGLIDDGREVFGNVTAQPVIDRDELNGFAALAVFDQPSQGGNGDGWIGPRDRIYRQLRLWQDRNHNGISEPSEFSSLEDAGVTAISVDYKESGFVDQFGNAFRYRARVIREGRGRGPAKWAFDVFLRRYNPS